MSDAEGLSLILGSAELHYPVATGSVDPGKKTREGSTG